MSNIEHPARYAAAVKRNILANARKTWLAANPRAEEIEDAVCAGRNYNGYDDVSYTDDFIGSIASALDAYGKLSPKQCEAVLKGIDARAAKKAEWADKAAVLNASRKHLGVVGEKITMVLTVVHVVTMDGAYGVNYFHICEDADHNVVLYKGTAVNFPNKGQTATVTATVKEHGVRDGVKQTMIQRPKVVVNT